MNRIESIVESLEMKISKVLNKLNQLKIENNSLRDELNSQIELNKEQISNLAQKENELESLRVASAMLGSNDDKRASKLKINALIRDINECIASLSD
jgi:septal ring factor EnvC (AmiA/AmiB activator)|tara:strand:- start:324 stop:614 length:291 start_codon:yes stop_codon:yes gene_type:complete